MTNFATLKVQLELFTTSFSGQAKQTSFPSLSDVQKYVQSLSPAMRSSISEVIVLLKLILIMPATNAVSERSASALR